MDDPDDLNNLPKSKSVHSLSGFLKSSRISRTSSSDLSHSTLNSSVQFTTGRRAQFSLGSVEDDFVDDDEGSLSDDEVTSLVNKLGTVLPLWKLVMDCLSLFAEAGDDDVVNCMKRIRVVCSDDFDPNEPGEAMRALANVFFDEKDSTVLLNCLDQMDGFDDDVDQEVEEKKPRVQVLLKHLDELQGSLDPQVRRWAIKSLWKLLHLCERHEMSESILPGLVAFEVDLLPVSSASLVVLLNPDATLNIPYVNTEQRKRSVRCPVIRKAFANTLLSRMISLEQRQRKTGSNASFALGSVGSGASSAGNRTSLGCLPLPNSSSIAAAALPSNIRAQSTLVERELHADTKLQRKTEMSTIRNNGEESEGDGNQELEESIPLVPVVPVRKSGFRSSGLRGSRLAQLISAARRSSMSMIGSVHTFKSADLDFGESSRFGSGLGIDAKFYFPRLTNISIPEHEIYDQKIWSSKSGGSGAFQSSGDTSKSGGFSVGIDYVDCATIFEIILGRIVDPGDPTFMHTINPFLQQVSAAGKELLPVLLTLLGWMNNSAIRREFLASVYTLTLANQHNLETFHSIDGLRTCLYRILQTIPSDPDFRDESADSIVRYIVDLLCLTSIPLLQHQPQQQRFTLCQSIYEIAVVSGWNKDSIAFVRTMLTTLVLYTPKQYPMDEFTKIVRLVETFVLYLPCKDDAVLGFTNRPRRVRECFRGEDDATTSHTGYPSTLLGSDTESSSSGDSSSEGGVDWHWNPILSRNSPLEVAENQVMYLEFKDMFQRRGVDYGFHMDFASVHFCDIELLGATLRAISGLLVVTDITPEQTNCLTSVQARLKLVLELLLRQEESVSKLRYHSELGVDEKLVIKTTISAQFKAMEMRVLERPAADICQCNFCRNTRQADVFVLDALKRLKARIMHPRSRAHSSTGGKLDHHVITESELIESAEHFLLHEDPECSYSVTVVSQNGNALGKSSRLDTLCPICKEDTAEQRDLSPRGGASKSIDDLCEEALVSKIARVTFVNDPQFGPPSPIHKRDLHKDDSVVNWAGYAWHARHCRCYSCSKVLDLNDSENMPTFDEIGAWPYCSECMVALLKTCPNCSEIVAEDDKSSCTFRNHRSWHKGHLRCSSCGGGASRVTDGVALCSAHVAQEILKNCSMCHELIPDDEVVVVSPGVFVHNREKCFKCQHCSKALTIQEARSNKVDPKHPYCADCIETSVRPSCALCAEPILLSAPRKILVPARANRLEVETFDLVDGVVTGCDGRLRCHDHCLKCSFCKRELTTEEMLSMIPSNDNDSYVAFCKDHVKEMLEHTNLLSEGERAKHLSSRRSSYSSAGLVTEEEDQSSAAQISAGLFLYVKDGVQCGPVNGGELCELAISGEINADTNVWTPGMLQWKPLSELGL